MLSERKTKMETKLLLILHVIILIHIVAGKPEQGVWNTDFDTKQNIHAFARSVYKNTIIKVTVEECKQSILKIQWILRKSPCSNEYENIESDYVSQSWYLNHPEVLPSEDLTYTTVEYLKGEAQIVCADQHPALIHQSELWQTVDAIPYLNFSKIAEQSANGAFPVKLPNASNKDASIKPSEHKRRKRANAPAAVSSSPTTTTVVAKVVPSVIPTKKEDNYLAQVESDGYFVFIMHIDNSTAFKARVTVEFDSEHGKIGAVDWPLLVFFGVIGLFYIILGLLWLILLACNWRDLLRVQFWIGAVLVLGMLEAAVFFGEYENVSKAGTSVKGAVILGELVSALKRTLARMLVIVVSLGFGIVKPRLGQTFHKVLCVGGLFFILSSIEGCMRAMRKTGDPQKDVLLAAVPLAVVDAVICWWIFSGLVQTTRTLRLRRNIVKLSLYRHFTNTLIFAVITSIGFMIWSVSQHKLKLCLTDWKELWVDQAFWHLFFFIILFIIMILWRPSSNNQRYAFSPLLDAADEDEEENVMHDAFEGMKMRGTKSQVNGSPRQKDAQTKVDDDLKWVEENIPSSIADKALPSLLDSDEEIMTTKYEMSKME